MSNRFVFWHKITKKLQSLNYFVPFAIDDFEMGYSSLNYLINLPVNKLKVDKLFIDNIENEKNQAVIGSIVDLAKIINYEVIAEGVETKE